jgi:hypothetical protein
LSAGACHRKGIFYSLGAAGNGVGLSLSITFSDNNDPGQKGALTAKLLQFCKPYKSFTLCHFFLLPTAMIAQIMGDITGTDFKGMDPLN